MQRLFSTFLFLVLLLSACSSNSNITTPTATQKPMSTKATLPVPTVTKSVVTETVAPIRKAVITNNENDVSARALFSEDFLPASIGMNIQPSGGVETGVDGRARLDLLPEGTIIRVGVNTSLTIIENTIDKDKPQTTIELIFGKVFILLNGGSLDVKTSMGIASVSGSLMRVEYDPQKRLLIASCLEGHCRLKNKNGDVVELVAGEFSYIEGGQLPVSPEKIYREEIQEWLAEIPELAYFLAVLPDPKDYPKQNRDPILGIPTPTHDDEMEKDVLPSYPNP